MTTKCPKCGASFTASGGGWTNGFFDRWQCGSSGSKDSSKREDFFKQSSKCKIAELQQQVEQLLQDRARSINVVGSRDEADFWHEEYIKLEQQLKKVYNDEHSS